MGMMVELINKLEEMKQGWIDTAAECNDFGDTTGACYSRGVYTGIDDCIKKIEYMVDKELDRYAAGN